MSGDAFRKAVESEDLDAMIACFAEDSVLHSPITFKPFEGRAAIRQLLGILTLVFQDLHYTDQLEAAEGTVALIFRAEVDGKQLEGLDLIRFDEAGLIRDFTVMVRPRSAIEALLVEVGSRLAKAQPSG